jgi:hypothetical protein
MACDFARKNFFRKKFLLSCPSPTDACPWKAGKKEKVGP